MKKLLLVVLLLPACKAPFVEGVRGNRAFADSAFVQARAHFLDGLARVDSLPSRTRAAFLNNTGLSYSAEGNGTEALAAFEAARAAAPRPSIRADVDYNAGVAAYQIQQRDQSLDYFRAALVARETHDSARFNWEVVKRQQKKEQNRSGGSPPPPPSDFARELKARAERLAAQRRYREAFDLMQQGLLKDPTVAAFGDFTSRLGTVADINQLAPTTPR